MLGIDAPTRGYRRPVTERCTSRTLVLPSVPLGHAHWGQTSREYRTTLCLEYLAEPVTNGPPHVTRDVIRTYLEQRYRDLGQEARALEQLLGLVTEEVRLRAENAELRRKLRRRD
jgi:hypothetical protein